MADRLVWTLVNRGQFGPEDFEQRSPESGVFLAAHSQRGFFEAYEKWMLSPVVAAGGLTFRVALQKEVEAWVAYLRESSGPWTPFSFGAERGGVANAGTDRL